MTIRLINASREAQIADINTRLNAGAGAGQIRFYSGGVNSTKGSLPTGTLLCTLTLADPAIALDGDGNANFGTIADALPVAVGTIACFVATDSDGTVVLDGTAGTSGTDVIVSNTTTDTSVPLSVASATIGGSNN